ncbi:MAG: cellulase family glycosylhydrolase [Kiritimatiellia bacterium]|nr:cellulase family glycosylhydrolase [Kiritimatiellia bacterium]
MSSMYRRFDLPGAIRKIGSQARNTAMRIVPVVVILLLTPVISGAQTEFVRRSGAHFMLGRQRYYFMGANCYYLSYFAQDTTEARGEGSPTWRDMADQVLDRCGAMDLNVVRIWAFGEENGGEFGPHDDWRMQTSPGVYREQALVGLDYVLQKAGELDLRIVLALVNNWDSYGGMDWYVTNSPTATTHDDFYTDATCRQWYKDHVNRLAGRTNTFTGIVYKEDPAIFAWQLANEPRCKSDTNGVTMANWVYEMAGYIKSVDTNHMVSTGEEGWWESQPWEGTRWLVNNACPDIDYAVIHCWPDSWTYLFGDSEPGLYSNAMRWVAEHIDACEDLLDKPLVLDEYGKSKPIEGDYGRNYYHQGWFDIIHESAASDGAAAGLQFWMFEADDSWHEDHGSVFYSDTSTVAMITGQAWEMSHLIAPVITGATFEPGGLLLSWTEVVGSPSYRISASVDMLSWEDLATVDTNEWSDSGALGQETRFYRIVPEYDEP